MDIKNIIRKGILAVLLVAVIAGVFWLSREKVTEDVTHCAVIATMTAALLPYFYNSSIKSILLASIFVAIIVGVYWLAQTRITQDPAHCALIAIMTAAIIPYFYNRYVYTLLPETDHVQNAEHVKNTEIEAKEIEAKRLRAGHRRLEGKVRALTAELSAATLKLDAEISDRPIGQRQLQQRLKHLNCLYELSNIVNREEISLGEIFQKTVSLIRNAHKYPDIMCVRITFDGIRYTADDFKKSKSSRKTEIKAHGETVGIIEVYNFGGKVNADEELFLKEEDNLLRAVAEWLGSIADRKKAEEKLRLFRNLIERSNDCIFAIEPRWGRFLDVNNRACDSLGYTRKELLDMMTIKDIEESVEDDSSWQKQVAKLKLNNDIVKEGKYKRKDGSTFFVETSLKLVTQEEQDYIIAIARDITERKRADAKLKTAQEKLLETAREVGMAEVATGVLHNVGNVLNSVSVTAESVQKRVRNSKISYLSDVVALLTEHAAELGTFMTAEARGKKIPAFLANLSEELIDEQGRCLESLEALTKHVQDVGDIIQLQQSHANSKGLIEPTSIAELVENSLQINAEALKRDNVQVQHNLATLPTLLLDRHKVMQILTNLISNATYALSEGGRQDKVLTIDVKETESGHLQIDVCDNGVGIPEENLTRIFEHGFTTKIKGHGFGLHSTALSANELNGSIVARSDGPGKGAVFTVELPFQTQEAVK
ncbi:MAG: PAS domain S-box protein [Phycisphaerae bacterium]|nr:PAS domain S-box protein [Phycisphaerae bacterium]